MNNLIIVLYNLLILLLPYNLNYLGLSYSKILFLFSIIIYIYLILKKRINKDIFKNKVFKYISIGFFILFVTISFSTCINAIFDKKIILSNFFEILRVIEYYTILTNYYILLSDKKSFKYFNISFICILLFNFIIAFLQFHNIFGLNELYVKFIAPTQFDTLVNGYKYPRAVALIGNPNEFGMYMSFGAIYMLYLNIKSNKYLYLILYLMFTFGVYLASSRTSYLSLILGSGMLIIFHYFKFTKVGILNTFKYGFLILLLQIILFFSLPDIYSWRIKTILNINNQVSWQERLDKNKDFFDSLNDSDDNEAIIDDTEENISSQKEIKELTFLIGNGPDKLKEKHFDFFDNEWLKIFFNYGILGILAYISLFILPIVSIIKKSSFDYGLYGSLVLSSFIYMITLAIYNNSLLFSILCILIAISFNAKISNFKKINKSKNK